MNRDCFSHQDCGYIPSRLLGYTMEWSTTRVQLIGCFMRPNHRGWFICPWEYDGNINGNITNIPGECSINGVTLWYSIYSYTILHYTYLFTIYTCAHDRLFSSWKMYLILSLSSLKRTQGSFWKRTRDSPENLSKTKSQGHRWVHHGTWGGPQNIRFWKPSVFFVQ